MKTRFFNLLSLVCCAAMLVGCSYGNDRSTQEYGGGHIVLDFSAANTRSRATIEADNVESAVDHLDVFIFENDGTTTPPEVHYERITTTAGRAVLNKSRSSFAKEKTYWVYILANCTYSSNELNSRVSTLADLKQIQQIIIVKHAFFAT